MTNKKVLFRTLKGGESIENKKFFTSCEGLTLSKRTELRRTSFALRKNGVIAMEELCQLLGHSPEKIAELGDVGAKSLVLIKEVCLLYEREGEALQKESLPKMDMLPQSQENIIERNRSKEKF